LRERVYPFHQELDLCNRAIQLNEQEAAAIRIIGLNRGFGGLNCELVHHFHRRRQHSGRNDVADRRAGFIRARESSEKRADALWTFDDSQDYFGGDSERTLRADEYAREIISRSIERLVSEVQQRAVRHHHFEAENVRSSKAVLQTVRAAGIFRDVPADAADRLGGRVRRVKISLRFNAGRHVEVDDARFHHNAGIRQVHFKDAIHARQADHDTVADGKGAATEASSRAARNERNPFSVTEANDGLDLFGIQRQQNGERHDAKVCQSVALVGVQPLAARDESTLINDGTEFVEKLSVHGRQERRIVRISRKGKAHS